MSRQVFFFFFFVTLFVLCCSYWNISSWLCGPQLLHPDSRDPSGAHRSVSAGAAEPADMKVESHQPSSTMFHTPALTGLPGGGRDKKKKKKRRRSSTNNLGVVSRHSSSAKQSQAGWAVGKRGSVTSACPGLFTLQGSGSTLTKSGRPQPPATPSRSSRGLSFTHLISQGVGHRPDRPR